MSERTKSQSPLFSFQTQVLIAVEEEITIAEQHTDAELARSTRLWRWREVETAFIYEGSRPITLKELAEISTELHTDYSEHQIELAVKGLWRRFQKSQKPFITTEELIEN